MIAIALVVIALNPWLTSVRALLGPRHAAGETAQAKYEYTIPKAWGKVVPYSNGKVIVQMKFN